MAAPSTDLRFSAPSFNLAKEHRWLLQRAFGPLGQPCAPPDPQMACRVALLSGLAARIATRTPGETLKRELRDHASELKAASRQALSHALAYEHVAQEVSAVARQLDQPVVFLKGFALNAADFVVAGSREVGDLDILVESDQADAFHQRLAQAGFKPTKGRANEHHLPPLQAPSWGIVDLHFSLRGVSEANGQWLSASHVLAVGQPVETHPACWVPDRLILAAHAAAHAVEQHASSPNPYPLLRSVGDLIDLLSEAQWQAAMPRLGGWLDGAVSPDELAAIQNLCLELESGRIPGPRESPARRLLDHFLAHRFDDGYRAGLVGQHRRHRIRQAWQRGTLVRYALRKITGLWSKR